MAKNLAYKFLEQFNLPVPAGTKSGDPVIIGRLAGIAMDDEGLTGNASGYANVKFKGGPVAILDVKGVNGSGNSAVSVGDAIYFVSADTPKLSKKSNTGVYYGIALQPVQSGATTKILVLLCSSPGGLGELTGETHSNSIFTLRHMDAADIADGTLVSNFTPEFGGTIIGFQVLVTAAITTIAKTTTLKVKIGNTVLTGGVLTLAGAKAAGTFVASTAITGNNAFNDTDTISITAESTTEFIEGEVEFILILRQS